MASKQNRELLNVAIQRLLEEKRKDRNPDDDFLAEAEDELLLSKLLSQIESLKQEGPVKGRDEDEAPPLDANAGYQPKSGIENEDNPEKNGGGRDVVAMEEIVKEVRHVRRQNTITHCLLSIMIVLTVAWQLSEVSLILKLKEGISHPFRSFGSMITGMFKPKIAAINDHNGDSNDQNLTEPSQLPPLQMPELPHFDIPDMGGERQK